MEGRLPLNPQALFFSHVVYRFSSAWKEPAFSPRAAIDFSALMALMGTKDWQRRPGPRVAGLPGSRGAELPIWPVGRGQAGTLA